MISKIKSLIFAGMKIFAKKSGVNITEIQYLIKANNEGKLFYWLYTGMKPEREIEFSEAVGLKGKIQFIDYETMASNFIMNKMDGYIKADGISPLDIAFLIGISKENKIEIIVLDNEKKIDRLEINELFE